MRTTLVYFLHALLVPILHIMFCRTGPANSEIIVVGTYTGHFSKYVFFFYQTHSIHLKFSKYALINYVSDVLLKYEFICSYDKISNNRYSLLIIRNTFIVITHIVVRPFLKNMNNFNHSAIIIIYIATLRCDNTRNVLYTFPRLV